MSSSTRTRRRSGGAGGAANDNTKEVEEAVTYDAIMGRGGTAGSEKGTATATSNTMATNADAAKSLSSRLVTFRTWLNKEAKVTVHSAICIVNGEATDGTRNAPVLVFGPPPDESGGAGGAGGSTSNTNTALGRTGNVDGEADQALYDRTMGCQLRAVREIKKDETLMTVPRGAMITPDLVAASDAGKAVLACCRASAEHVHFWDAFENTTICRDKLSAKIPRNNGPQTLVKILQERKKVESAFQKHSDASTAAADGATSDDYKLAEPKTISTMAPLLAFLIHQRFSNSERPLVSEHSFESITDVDDGNALSKASDDDMMIQVPPESPETFAPYARTLPSSVSLPLCWKRSELALLTACAAGHDVLQTVASTTLHLAVEFMALMNAGILKRFPDVFPEGVLTWERWVWACAMVSSRTLPASLYLDKGMEDASNFKPEDSLEFQSPADTWNELGVMVPLLDMLNHEEDAYQVTWDQGVPANMNTASSGVEGGDDDEMMGDDGDETTIEPHPPRAIAHKKVRKGSEIFTCYGVRDNGYLISQYGFALMNNSSDQVRLGLGLADAVGNVKPPHDHEPQFEVDEDFVFESNDEKAINAWWTEDRLKILNQEALSVVDEDFKKSLIAGRKLVCSASNDGTFDPILISVAVLATMPQESLRKNLAMKQGSNVVISKRHQVILQRYLEFFFARKLEKLLQILDNGLRGHFDGVSLWTKTSKGGLDYQEELEEGDAANEEFTGWQSLFDSRAYKTAMEVEKHYYSMGSDSCVLTLYDGQLRALHTAMKSVCSDGKLSDSLVEQLTNLRFDVVTDDGTEDTGPPEPAKNSAVAEAAEAAQEGKEAGNNGRDSNGGGRSPRRKRNRGKNKNNPGNGRPPALKLHVGNLSYKTTPSDLYDYFCSLYGEANILECHIPTERESGRSRGFGFVAMPEEMALKVLQSGKKHEVGGRVVKIAKSNSVGSSSSSRISDAPAPKPGDRCPNCGYSPRYCTCNGPRMPSGGPPGGGYDHPPAVGPYGPSSYERDVLMAGPPPPPRGSMARGYGEYRGSHERYDRYGRHDDYPYDRSDRHSSSRYGEPPPSRSYERGDDRRMSRRERDRSRDRSRSPRRWDHDEGRSFRRDRRSEGSWDDRDRKRSRTRSRSRERSRKKKSKRRTRSRSRSVGSG